MEVLLSFSSHMYIKKPYKLIPTKSLFGTFWQCLSEPGILAHPDFLPCNLTSIQATPSKISLCCVSSAEHVCRYLIFDSTVIQMASLKTRGSHSKSKPPASFLLYTLSAHAQTGDLFACGDIQLSSKIRYTILVDKRSVVKLYGPFLMPLNYGEEVTAYTHGGWLQNDFFHNYLSIFSILASFFSIFKDNFQDWLELWWSISLPCFPLLITSHCWIHPIFLLIWLFQVLGLILCDHLFTLRWAGYKPTINDEEVIV